MEIGGFRSRAHGPAGGAMLSLLPKRLVPAMTHPFALSLLAISAAFAGIMLVPTLQPLYDRAVLVLALGSLAYVASFSVLAYFPSGTIWPELESVAATRDALARLARKQGGGGRGSERTALVMQLGEAISELDDEIIPGLGRVLARSDTIEQQLALYADGTMPTPGDDVLERLEAILAREHHAAQECALQAANAHAAIVAMLQTSDDNERIESQARQLANRVLAMHEALDELLRGDEDEGVGEPEVDSVVVPDAPRITPPSPSPYLSGGLPRLTERALKSLNNPMELARCALLGCLPRTLAETNGGRGDREGEPTSLEQAQVLRDTMVAAIERLKPTDSNGNSAEPAALHYLILRKEYVMGMSAKHVMVRLSLPESSFHRHRRAAVAALARELQEQEAKIAGRTS